MGEIEKDRGGTRRGMPRPVPDESDEKPLRPASVSEKERVNDEKYASPHSRKRERGGTARRMLRPVQRKREGEQREECLALFSTESDEKMLRLASVSVEREKIMTRKVSLCTLLAFGLDLAHGEWSVRSRAGRPLMYWVSP